MYTAFLQEINASVHVPCPELKKKLEDTPVATIKPKEKNVKCKPSKRKTSSTTPLLRKQPRIDHFLEKNRQTTQNPT
jgi:hypothetical protein